MPTPTEHDTRWLELMTELGQAERSYDSATSSLLHSARYRKSHDGWSWRLDQPGQPPLMRHQAVKAVSADYATAPDEWVMSYSGTKGSLLMAVHAAELVQRAAAQALAAHERGYTGWSRYFLVTSSNGLVHKSMHCSTCNKGRQATQFALLPTLSGLAFTAAVEALGPSLCSVCYPEAPVSVVDGPKLPARVTSLLFTSQEAFLAELAKYNADADKRAATAAKRAETKRLTEERARARRLAAMELRNSRQAR